MTVIKDHQICGIKLNLNLPFTEQKLKRVLNKPKRIKFSENGKPDSRGVLKIKGIWGALPK